MSHQCAISGILTQFLFAPEKGKPMKRVLLAALCPLILGAQSTSLEELREPREVHLRNVKKLTGTGSNAEAYWSNDGKKIVFQSTRDAQGAGPECPEGPPFTPGKYQWPVFQGFDLFRINLDGTGLDRITWTGVFNSFPHFSSDGKKLLWVSGRKPRGSRQFDVCVAEWLP